MKLRHVFVEGYKAGYKKALRELKESLDDNDSRTAGLREKKKIFDELEYALLAVLAVDLVDDVRMSDAYPVMRDGTREDRTGEDWSIAKYLGRRVASEIYYDAQEEGIEYTREYARETAMSLCQEYFPEAIRLVVTKAKELGINTKAISKCVRQYRTPIFNAVVEALSEDPQRIMRMSNKMSNTHAF